MRCLVIPLLLAGSVASGGCTAIKPVACGLVHPVRSVASLFRDTSSNQADQVDDAPSAVGLIQLPLVLPVFYAYKMFVGVVGGFTTGLVSDFNVVSGHAGWSKSIENLTRPDKTNAVR